MTDPYRHQRGMVERFPAPPSAPAQTSAGKAPLASRHSAPVFQSDGCLPMEQGLTREHAWNLLGPRTRQRLQQLAGTSIEWWAEVRGREEQVFGYLLGESGFAIAEPVFDGNGRPMSRVSCYYVDPASFRHVPVEWRPVYGASMRSRSSEPPATSQPPSLQGVGRMDRALVGSMPAKAQQLLMQPFSDSGEQIQRCEIYYEGTRDTLDLFVAIMAGSRTLTAATGTRYTPAGADEAHSHWSLVCRRAAVIRRAGR